MRRVFARSFKYMIALALCASVGSVLIGNAREVDLSALRLQPWLLAASFLFYFAHMSSQALVWSFLGRLCDASLPLATSFRYWAYSQLGKYLPGKVFRVGYLAMAYKRHGHDLHKVSVLVGLEFVGSLAGVILVLSSCAFLAGADLPRWVNLLGAFLFLASLAGCHPTLLNLGLRILEIVLRRPRGSLAMEFRFRDILASVPLYAFSYLFLAASNWFFFASILGFEDVPSFALSTAVFGAAGLAGSFAFFAPGGLGAREAVLQIGLQSSMGAARASFVTLASRLWYTLCELTFLGGVWLWNWRITPSEDSPSSGRSSL